MGVESQWIDTHTTICKKYLLVHRYHKMEISIKTQNVNLHDYNIIYLSKVKEKLKTSSELYSSWWQVNAKCQTMPQFLGFATIKINKIIISPELIQRITRLRNYQKVNINKPYLIYVVIIQFLITAKNWALIHLLSPISQHTTL